MFYNQVEQETNVPRISDSWLRILFHNKGLFSLCFLALANLFSQKSKSGSLTKQSLLIFSPQWMSPSYVSNIICTGTFMIWSPRWLDDVAIKCLDPWFLDDCELFGRCWLFDSVTSDTGWPGTWGDQWVSPCHTLVTMATMNARIRGCHQHLSPSRQS